MSARLPQSAAGGARWRRGGHRPGERGGAGGTGARPALKRGQRALVGGFCTKAGVAAGNRTGQRVQGLVGRGGTGEARGGSEPRNRGEGGGSGRESREAS